MDELLELEHAGWASLCNGTGAEFYGGLMTDDGVMVLADGTVMTRSDVVEALGKSPPWANGWMAPRAASLGGSGGFRLEGLQVLDEIRLLVGRQPER